MTDAANDNAEQKPEETPAGRAQKWVMEFAPARKALDEWHRDAAEAVKRAIGKKGEGQGRTKLNLYPANDSTLRALLYGKTPKVDVARRFGDSQDDVGRVAGEMMERCLNADIEKDSDNFATALELALTDRLRAGAGVVRETYVAEFETQTEPAITAVDPMTGETLELAPAVEREVKTYECVETDWVHWKDVLWSDSRVWHEVRWLAFRTAMSREKLIERFGEDVGNAVPLNTKGAEKEDGKRTEPWARADVWEIWDKEAKRVDWYVEGYPAILDTKPDPYGLDGFWPCPRPMFANTTTDALVPTPDFTLAKDLYDEAETLSVRIRKLEKAVKVVGVFDKTATGIQRMLQEGTDNDLIPIENWAMFGEKGGLKGVVDWFPLEMVVATLDKLSMRLTEVMGLLFQVTGMSDIMRGQASTQTTATEQAIKARFASARVQALQDEVARFASDAQRIKAEIIAKHFDPATIVRNSNVEHTQDAQLAGPAVELIKSQLSQYRIEVKPENISLTDFAALKQERTEVLQAVGGFMQSVAPLAQGMPGSMPFLLELLQWTISGLKGASTIEGVFDRAIEQAKQAAMQPQQPQPDPRMEAMKVKAGVDMQKAKMDLVSTQAKTQAHMMKTQADIAKLQAARTFNGPGGAANENDERNEGVQAVNAITGGGQ